MAQSVPSNVAQAVVALGNEIRTKYPRAFEKCHKEVSPGQYDPEAGDFIILFAQECKKRDIAAPLHHVGLNGKRGTDEMSLDVLSFMDRNGVITDVRVVDMVVGAGAPGATIGFNDVTDPTGVVKGKYIDPNTKQTFFDYDNGTDDCLAKLAVALNKIKQLEEQMKNMVNKTPYAGDEQWDQFGKIILKDYGRAGRNIIAQDGSVHTILDAQSFRWAGRTIHDDYMEGITLEESIVKHRKEWCGILGIPVD